MDDLKKERSGKSSIIQNDYLLLSLLVFIGFFLRFYLIPQNLFFGPEQGIDFLVIKDIIIHKNLILIGSKTDIEGIFHGPFYYYLAGIPFIVSKGSPIFVSAFFIFLHSFTVVPLYFLGKRLWNTGIARIAALLFTVSYEAIIFSRWLSNPPLSILLSALFFLFYLRYSKEEDWNLIILAVLFGLLVQVQFLNLLFFSLILIAILFLDIKRLMRTGKRYLLVSTGLLLLISVGNYIFFDLRNQFLISGSLLKLLSGKTGFYKSYGSEIISVIKTLSYFFQQLFFPFIHSYSLVPAIIFISLLVFLMYKKMIKKESVLLIIWIFLPLITMIILRHEVLLHYLLPLMVPLLLIAANCIYKISRNNKAVGIGILSVIVLSNLLVFAINIPGNKHIYFQENQPELRIADQKTVVDAIYQDIRGDKFSFQSYTIPYWYQQGWKYLFWYYGEQRYGYYPAIEKAETLYVIIQPDPSNNKYQTDWLKQTVPTWGKKINEFQYGKLRVLKLKASWTN